MRRDELPAPFMFGSVCSGIEAASAAWLPLGWHAAWVAEIEPFPARVLHHHYGSGRPLHMPSPDVDDLTDPERDERRAAIKAVADLPAVDVGPRNLGDMTKIAAMVRAGAVAAPDVLVGGTPCQAFSIAGLRASLDDARGQLTLSFVELADAIDAARHVRGEPATIITWENVPGVLSTKDNAFGCFLGALAGEDSPLLPPGGKWPNAGCVFGPKRDIAWRVLDAQYFGVAQRRRRVFLIASARADFNPSEVLFEQDGVRRDFAPSRETGQDVAGTVVARAGRSGGIGTDEACSGQLQPAVLPCARTGGAEVAINRSPTLTCNHEAPIVAGTLQSGGRAAGSVTQQDAMAGMLIPICFSMKDYGGDATVDLAPTLRAGNHTTSHANGGQPPAIAFDARQDCVSSADVFGALGSSSPQAQAVCFAENSRGELRLEGGDGSRTGALSTGGGKPGQGQPVICITGDITHTLKAEGFDASEDGTGRGHPIVTAFKPGQSEAAGGIFMTEEYAPTLQAANNGSTAVPAIQQGMSVRRLTPRECERLQAYRDDYTLIPVRKITAKRAVALQAKGEIVMAIDGQWWKLADDGPRYKALGNSMCTRNMAWIGRRICAALAAANFTHEREIARVT